RAAREEVDEMTEGSEQRQGHESPEAAEWLADIAAAPDAAALQDLRVRLIGKKGAITQQLKQLGQLDPEQRREQGQRINVLKQSVEQAIEARKAQLERQKLDEQLASESVDVTLPGTRPTEGGQHLLTLVTNRLLD